MWLQSCDYAIRREQITLTDGRESGSSWMTLNFGSSEKQLGFASREEFLEFVDKIVDLATPIRNEGVSNEIPANAG